MSRKGDCWDNAAMESFFSTLKTERLARKVLLVARLLAHQHHPRRRRPLAEHRPRRTLRQPAARASHPSLS